VHAEARARGLPVHMHVAETKKEVEDCRAAYGRAPLELLLERLELDPRFTAVHGTQSDPAALAALFERGSSLCVTPLTEADLGDGIPRLAGLSSAALALGTDANARISMLEELRWLELGQRLAREARGVLADASGAVAPRLLAAATQGGARSLGLAAGAIERDRWADFVEIDLSAAELAGWTQESLPDSLVFGAGNRSIAATWVGGKRAFEREG